MHFDWCLTLFFSTAIDGPKAKDSLSLFNLFNGMIEVVLNDEESSANTLCCDHIPGIEHLTASGLVVLEYRPRPAKGILWPQSAGFTYYSSYISELDPFSHQRRNQQS